MLQSTWGGAGQGEKENAVPQKGIRGPSGKNAAMQNENEALRAGFFQTGLIDSDEEGTAPVQDSTQSHSNNVLEIVQKSH